MKVYAYEHTIKKSGVLIIKKHPFNVGEKIEVFIIPSSIYQSGKKKYPFWAKPIKYLNPNPAVFVAEADWDV